MMLIVVEDFEGLYNIAGIEKPAIRNLVQNYIDKYEVDYARKLLGDDLKTALWTGLAANPIEAKWVALKTIIKDKCINYVMYKYIERTTSFNTTVGEASPQAENAEMISPAQRLISIWNELAEWFESDWAEWMEANEATYPEYEYGYEFEHINIFGV